MLAVTLSFSTSFLPPPIPLIPNANNFPNVHTQQKVETVMEEEVLSVGKKGVLEGAELHCLHQKGLLSLVMGWELARTVISPLHKMCQVHFSSFFLIFDLPPRSLCVCYACGIERASQ